MSAPASRALPLALAIAAALAGSPPAHAHAALKRSTPAAQATLDAAPREVVLTFDEPVEEAFSAVTIRSASGKEVATARAHIDETDRTTLRLALPPLAPGAYAVRWVAVGHDGHRRTGDFGFTVR